jgi:hypothetical protein
VASTTQKLVSSLDFIENSNVTQYGIFFLLKTAILLVRNGNPTCGVKHIPKCMRPWFNPQHSQNNNKEIVTLIVSGEKTYVTGTEGLKGALYFVIFLF